MRFYGFGNMYLSSLQQGLQNAHAVHELFNNWREGSSSQNRDLLDWSENHKTMILLNAGYSDNIRSLISRFESTENPYAWAPFYEGQDSLDGALTTVAIILPEKIYESSAYLRSLSFRDKKDAVRSIEDTGTISFPIWTSGSQEDVKFDLSKWEFGLIQEINNYGMAS